MVSQEGWTADVPRYITCVPRYIKLVKGCLLPANARGEFGDVCVWSRAGRRIPSYVGPAAWSAAGTGRVRMPKVLKVADLPASGGARRFEGGPYGANVSFFLIDSAPGQGPELHSHPYAEVFVIRRGHAQFTLDGKTIDAESGDIVVAPAEAAHRFVNAGPSRLEMINIHASGDMLTRWLSDAE